MSVAFTGEADINNAIAVSERVYSKLVGTKLISIGGGDEDGYITAQNLTTLDTAITTGAVSAAGYVGICFDVEEADSGLSAAFANSFALAKEANLMVFITISHSSPYGVSDAETLMSSFFSNPNVDIISPQLYTRGNETENDYIAVTVPWSAYADSHAAIVPSIVDASYYQSAYDFFASLSPPVLLQGFVQWSH